LNAPSVKLYQLCKSREDPPGYRLPELYESRDVLDSHEASVWFKAGGPKLSSLSAERATIEYYETIG
jgi:quinol monooxygenase YgiN